MLRVRPQGAFNGLSFELCFSFSGSVNVIMPPWGNDVRVYTVVAYTDTMAAYRWSVWGM